MTKLPKQDPELRAARIGYGAGKGMHASQIANELFGGTATVASTVKRLCKLWDIPLVGGHSVAEVAVPLQAAYRRKLEVEAEKRGIEPGEFVQQCLMCILDDDLYLAVTDGRFD